MISVILPVYNSEKYISESIHSILNQTYKDFEFIIINDGSTDSSEEIILSFNDERIRYYSNDKNRGLIYTLNRCVELSNREYIARMDADDISLTTRLEVQLNYMIENPDLGVCGSFVRVINEDGKVAEIIQFPINDTEIKSYLYFSCPLNHPSVLIRTHLLKNNLYSKDFKTAEDYELWIRLSTKTKFYNIPKPLLKYRIHGGNISILDIVTADNSTVDLLRGFIIPQLVNKTLIDNYIGFALRKLDKSIADYNFWLADFINEPLFRNNLFKTYFIKRWFGLCLTAGNYKFLLLNNLSKKMPLKYYSLIIKYTYQSIIHGFPRSLK